MSTFFHHLSQVHHDHPGLICGQPLSASELAELLWETWQAATDAARFQGIEAAPLEETYALSDRLMDSLGARSRPAPSPSLDNLRAYQNS